MAQAVRVNSLRRMHQARGRTFGSSALRSARKRPETEPRPLVVRHPQVVTTAISKLTADRGDVLLVYARGNKLETIKPGDTLHVVAVGPKGMENVIRPGSDVSVVAEEGPAEAVTCVNRLSSHDCACTGSQVAHCIV